MTLYPYKLITSREIHILNVEQSKLDALCFNSTGETFMYRDHSLTSRVLNLSRAEPSLKQLTGPLAYLF